MLSSFGHQINCLFLGLPWLGVLLATAHLGAVVAIDTENSTTTECRNIPGYPGWPSTEEWLRLNESVHGRLLASVPLASSCHTSGIAYYNATECARLQAEWDLPKTHLVEAGEIDSPWFQNQSCDPYTPTSQPCELGNYVSYSINVSDPTDVTLGIEFARANNVRLVVKNTGHDYLGKSTGKGGLAFWTHNLKSISIDTHYVSDHYHGPAIKLGAGVIASEAYIAASEAGYRVVGGTCATVGISGGYSQGGGHSILSSSYGLAADNVLEWEVVTATGQHLVATPSQHEDLYWALSGGGGGTYAVVLSMTAKLHIDGQVGGGSVSFNDSQVGNDVFWTAVGTWLANLPAFLDDGNFMLYELTYTSFTTYTIAAPGKNSSDVGLLLNPFFEDLDRLGVHYSFESHTSPTFLEHYSRDFGPLPYGPFPASQLINNRLIPRQTVMDPGMNMVLTDAMRGVTKTGHFYLGCHGVKARKPSTGIDNAVLPAWRDTVSLCLVVGNWDWTIPRSEMVARQTELMEEIMPPLVAATPNSGIYLNEGNFAQTDWQWEFYGNNYPSLRNIKRKYDPEGLFYGTTAVGSEDWTLDEYGRLCRAEVEDPS